MIVKVLLAGTELLCRNGSAKSMSKFRRKLSANDAPEPCTDISNAPGNCTEQSFKSNFDKLPPASMRNTKGR